jgi:hypothetical protein
MNLPRYRSPGKRFWVSAAGTGGEDHAIPYKRVDLPPEDVSASQRVSHRNPLRGIDSHAVEI